MLEHDAPYFMAMGMTYDQYWSGDVRQTKTFYKAFRLKQEQRNEQAWLHGMYVKLAIESSIGNAFRESGQQPVEYPRDPLGQEQIRPPTEEELFRKRLEVRNYLDSIVQAGKEGRLVNSKREAINGSNS